MKSKLPLLILGAALALPQAARAAEPPGAQATGKVLVLDNGRTLDGDIERHGEQYRIRRDMGEVWVPAAPEMKLCRDWHEAYEFMAARTNLLDADERLRLARWCHLRGMREQALAEVTAAVKMRPDHAESRQLHSVLERALVMGQTTAVARQLPEAPPPPPSDISSDSVALFITRVQPILMNTCVNCHSGGKGGDFQLYRSYHGGTQAATQKNLAAVLSQVDADHPVLSPLLIKSVSGHGNTGQPPIKSRHTVPYRTLQEWVDHLIRNNPHLQKKEHRGPTQLARTTPEPRSVPSFTLPAPAAVGVPKLEARQLPRDPEDKQETVRATPEPRTLPHLPSTPLTVEARPATTPPQAGSTPQSLETNAIQLTSASAPANPAPAAAIPNPLPPTTTASSPPAPSAAIAPPPSTFSSGQSPPIPEPEDPFDPAIFNRQMHPRR